MKSSVIVIVNPAARTSSADKIAAVASHLSMRGLKPEVLRTQKSGDAEVFASQAAKEEPEFVIAAGGDGTFNEVINGMAGSDVPVALLPMGTTNVLARELYGSSDFRNVLDTLTTGRSRPVSLGRVAADAAGKERSRYFSLMSGVGFDGDAVRGVSLRLKRVFGPGAYVISGMRTLLSYRPEELFFDIDGSEVSGHAAIIGNISRYGGDFKATPDARVEDPFLYCCIFRGRSRADLLRYLLLMLLGRHIKAKDVVYRKASLIKIAGSAPVQIDGDYFGMSPCTVSVAENALRMIY